MDNKKLQSISLLVSIGASLVLIWYYVKATKKL